MMTSSHSRKWEWKAQESGRMLDIESWGLGMTAALSCEKASCIDVSSTGTALENATPFAGKFRIRNRSADHSVHVI